MSLRAGVTSTRPVCVSANRLSAVLSVTVPRVSVGALGVDHSPAPEKTGFSLVIQSGTIVATLRLQDAEGNTGFPWDDARVPEGLRRLLMKLSTFSNKFEDLEFLPSFGVMQSAYSAEESEKLDYKELFYSAILRYFRPNDEYTIDSDDDVNTFLDTKFTQSHERRVFPILKLRK